MNNTLATILFSFIILCSVCFCGGVCVTIGYILKKTCYERKHCHTDDTLNVNLIQTSS